MKIKVELNQIMDEDGNQVGAILEKGGFRKKNKNYCFKCNKVVEDLKHFETLSEKWGELILGVYS